jgi:carbonic anhydrase
MANGKTIIKTPITKIGALVISYKLLGTQEWFIIHHSDCAMEFFTDEVIRALLASSLETASLGADGFFDVGDGPGSKVRRHPLVPKGITIYGYVYDVRTGALIEVPDATQAGAAK